MSGTQTSQNLGTVDGKGGNPRFMRHPPVPALTPDLEAAIPKRIVAGPATLNHLRSAAAAALRKTGLPHSGSEDFSFVRVGEFLPHLGPPPAAALALQAGGLPSRADIERQLVTEARESYLVLVDGVYSPELSKPGPDFQVDLLANRIDALPKAAGEHLIALVSAETDAPAAMAMLFAEPVFIQAAPAGPAGSSTDAQAADTAASAAPLLILHFSTGASRRSDAFIVYHGTRLSECRLMVRHAVMSRAVEHVPGAGNPATGSPEAPSKATGSMRNIHTVALIDEGASLKFLEAGPVETLNGEGSPDLSSAPAAIAAKAIQFGKLTARLDRNGRLLAVSAHTGSRLTRNSFSVDLAGEGAEAEINGATVLSGNRQSHHFVNIRHRVPHCVSRQKFKSVAADQSRSSVDGTILVDKGAQQTNAYQIINNLMLSDEARADSKPRLMIHADDVKCSHGATSGKLDPAQQFYLESRGLPTVQARALLTVAFIAEVLEKTGKAGEGFRDGLDHALLDSLKHRLPVSSQGAAHG
jgi:Fe-S cluster assembly scaffold protein SufB